jgi:hypothetical protein
VNPSSTARPEHDEARDARARALAFALELFLEKEGAARASDPEDAMKGPVDEHRAKDSIPEST